jgi:hypothetical protein
MLDTSGITGHHAQVARNLCETGLLPGGQTGNNRFICFLKAYSPRGTPNGRNWWNDTGSTACSVEEVLGQKKEEAGKKG